MLQNAVDICIGSVFYMKGRQEFISFKELSFSFPWSLGSYSGPEMIPPALVIERGKPKTQIMWI